MRITLLTYGSRGDVQPLAALALGLQAAGHNVLLAAPQRFADFVRGLSIPFAPLAGDPQAMSLLLNEAGGNPLAMVRSMQTFVAGIAPQVIAGAAAACRGAELIVHTFLFTTGAHALAQAAGIPDVSVQTFPTFAPTRAFPNVALAQVPPGPLSYWTHWLATHIFWRGGNAAARSLLQREPTLAGLKLAWPFAGPPEARTPLLFAYSPTVLPRPADWRAPNLHVTGYLFLPPEENFQSPPGLADFLAAGAPPVCVTFGSMVSRDEARIHHAVRAALAQQGKRAVFLRGWSAIQPDEADARFFYLDAAPHDWLLPQCSAVIHHGGAGTTAAGLRAGIPNLIVPHAADQPFWAKRVAAIGAGPAALDPRRLSVEKLVDGLAQTEDARLRQRAREVGARIRAEDGVAEAVRLIEEHGGR